MNNQNKALLAVIAVAMMLGCALVPLALNNSNDKGTDDTTGTDEVSDNTLSQYLETFRMIFENADIDFGSDISMIPVEATVGDATASANEFVGNNGIASGETVALSDGTITFAKDAYGNNGCLDVNEGATLVLFPDDGSNHIYWINNENGNDASVIRMHNGSMLNIFGMTFKFVMSDDDTYDLTGLFGADGAMVSENVLKMRYVPMNDGSMLFQIVCGNTVLFEFEGTLTVTEGNVAAKGMVALTVPREMYVGGVTVDANAEMNFNLDLKFAWNSAGDDNINGTFSADITEFCYSMALPSSVISPNLKGISFSTGDVDFEISNAAENGSVVRTTKLVAADGISLEFESGNKIILTNASSDITRKSDGSGEWNVVSGKYKANVSVLVDSIGLIFDLTDVQVDVKDNRNADISVGNFGARMSNTDTDFKFHTRIDVTDFVFYIVDGKTTFHTTISFSLYTMCNGYERALKLSIENFSLNVNEEKKLEFSLGMITVRNDIPLATIMKKKASFILHVLPMFGLDDICFEFGFNGLKFDEEQRMITSDLFYIDLLSAHGCKEFYVGFVDDNAVEIEGNDVNASSKNIYGFIMDFDGTKNEFSVTNNPKVGIGFATASFVGGSGSIIPTLLPYPIIGIKIIEGDAVFTGGTMPMSLIIGKDASFKADGLEAHHFYFEEGCKKSGTITIDRETMKAPEFAWKYIVEKVYPNEEWLIQLAGSISDSNGYYRFVVADGLTYGIGMYGISPWLPGSYVVTFDLDKMNSEGTSGTITANTGWLLPKSYSNDWGFSMTSDNDRLTANFTAKKIAITAEYPNADKVVYIETEWCIDRSVEKTKYGCERISYSLSYSDGTAPTESKMFGQKVELKQPTVMEDGKEFVGWTDGSGQIYQAGIPISEEEGYYVMPARDVVLTPVWQETIDNPKVKDKTITIDTDADEIAINMGNVSSDWSTMVINTPHGTVEFSKDTYDNMIKNDKGETPSIKYLFFDCMKVTECNDEYIMKSVKEGMSAFQFTLTYSTGGKNDVRNDVKFSEDTVFKVTVNVGVTDDPTGFAVNYVNPLGALDPVNVSGYEKCEDGTYNVTFEVNHFSYYTVEPTYEQHSDGGNNDMLWLVLLVIIIAIIGFIALMLIVEKNRY